MLTSLMVVIISKCICISKHHIVHHTDTQFLFVNFTSIRLWKNKVIELEVISTKTSDR